MAAGAEAKTSRFMKDFLIESGAAIGLGRDAGGAGGRAGGAGRIFEFV